MSSRAEWRPTATAPHGVSQSALVEDPRAIVVIAPHFKKRLSGVTSSIVQIVPELRRLGCAIATIGPGLPAGMPRLAPSALPQLWRRPKGAVVRVWHARRNIEMVAGVILRDGLRMPLKLVFTSAGQRRHKPFTRWLISRMDAIVATSARSGAYLDRPHRVIRHGIDLAAFHPPREPEDRAAATGLPGRYIVGCSGRIRHQKGTDLFVEAMIALLPRYPDWSAVVTGRITGEHQAFADDLKQRVSAAGLGERIVFLGEVDDIKLWYRRMTLYVAPSRNEGFGLTPLEAMASQTAVVASNAGAYAELVEPGDTGAVVPAGDGAALRAAIEPYLADPSHAEKAGQAGLARVRAEFGIDKEAGALIALYEELTMRSRP